MALEEAGVPTVAIHTHVFERLVRSVARANGMPITRQAFVPQPVVDRSAQQLRAYIEGDDPTTRRPFMQEVVEGLTRPLDAEDRQGVSFERTTPRLLEPAAEDDLQANIQSLKNIGPFAKKVWLDSGVHSQYLEKLLRNGIIGFALAVAL